MQSKILDRLVLYDFIGIVFTGMCAISISFYLISWGILNIVDLSITFSLSNTITYIVASYIVGITLHESALFFLKYNIYKNGKPSTLFLKRDIEGFEECDRENLKTAMNIYAEEHGIPKIKFNEGNNSYQVYDCCKFFLRQEGIYGTVEVIQSLYVLSRNLFVFVVFSAFLFPFAFLIVLRIFGYFNFINALICEVLLILIIPVFYVRTKKFSDIVVSRTLKTFSTYIITRRKSHNINTQNGEGS